MLARILKHYAARTDFLHYWLTIIVALNSLSLLSPAFPIHCPSSESLRFWGCEKETLYFMANPRIFIWIKYCHRQQEHCGPCSTPPSPTVSPGSFFPSPTSPASCQTQAVFPAISFTEPVKYQSCKFLQKSALADCYPRDYPTSKHLSVLAFPVAIHQEQAYFIGNK